MKFLTASSVIDLHKILIDKFGGLHGIRDHGLLESALAYPQLLYDLRAEHDIHVLAATYCFHLINNHSFVDGNKRIGVLAMITFLKINGYQFTLSHARLYVIAVLIATSKIDEKVVAQELKKFSRPL